MRKMLFALLSFSLLLTACTGASAPQKKSISKATVRSYDYGQYPKDYEKMIRADLEQRLFDYDSAKIKISVPPKKMFEVQSGSNDTTAYWLSRAFYTVCLEINAKNQYGGYTGWQTHQYKIWNSEIEHSISGQEACYRAKTGSEEITIINEAKRWVEIVE